MPDDSRVLVLHANDDVAIALQGIAAGTLIADGVSSFVARADIPAGHKVARWAMATGDTVHRYGQPIGSASAAIAQGEHVHTHNLAAGSRDLTIPPGADAFPADLSPPAHMRFFQGFRRADGSIGTRNCVLVISTVNCSASVCAKVRDRFRDIRRDYPNVDGVLALSHVGGCGSALGSDDHRTLMRVLGGWVRHPNTAGAVLVGLGCEKNLPSTLLGDQGLGGVPHFTIQEQGGTEKTVDAVSAAVRRLLPLADAHRRTREPISSLVLATKCGGSDSFSGITANPALGRAVDELIRFGGTALLAETPEICGAEHLLVCRAADAGVARGLVERVRWWEQWCARFGQSLEGNPSPGNIAGGITTLCEKSLGAVAKGGTSTLRDVISYADPLRTQGLVFMDTPGYDPVSVTGLIAGGATVVAFTTGCGSVYGSALVPTIKLASTTRLFKHMEGDMDVDCGSILHGSSIEEAGSSIFEKVLAVAGGARTKSESLGLGEQEFVPWLVGPVL